MKVIMERSCLVKPAEATWNGRMQLSEPDQTGVVTHVPTIYFYKNSQTPKQDTSTISTTLKTSLSLVLVHFYPLAGRLNWLDGCHIELDCNGKGVQFTEASSDAKLDDLGDFTPTTDFDYLIPQINYKDPLEDIPLLFVQLTKFNCGGLALSCSVSHVVADGQSAYHFISEWARIARGEPLGTRPFLDRKVLRAGDPPPAQLPHALEHDQYAQLPQLIGQSSSSNKETTIAMLKLSKNQVEMLKKEANRTRPCGEINRAYTRYESIVGHIWRCACKVRGHAHEQPTAMSMTVDVRRRMQPPLPEKFFGNAIVDVVATDLSGELVARPLGYASSRIREAIDRVTSEYVHSTIDYLKNLKDLSSLQNIHILDDIQGLPYGNPNVGAASWMTLPLYGMDFGYGKEIFMSTGRHTGDGDSMILPGYDGDGSLVVAQCLEFTRMDDFKNLFYQDIQTR